MMLYIAMAIATTVAIITITILKESVAFKIVMTMVTQKTIDNDEDSDSNADGEAFNQTAYWIATKLQS